mmetsp:Transcript_9785/g.13585  ORF Transcript_9785/g.13585 Transcript_9785/m.13585 type:complete len:211 (+) Transcript_9785:2517-3149(+)
MHIMTNMSSRIWNEWMVVILLPRPSEAQKKNLMNPDHFLMFRGKQTMKTVQRLPQLKRPRLKRRKKKKKQQQQQKRMNKLLQTKNKLMYLQKVSKIHLQKTKMMMKTLKSMTTKKQHVKLNKQHRKHCVCVRLNGLSGVILKILLKCGRLFRRIVWKQLNNGFRMLQALSRCVQLMAADHFGGPMSMTDQKLLIYLFPRVLTLKLLMLLV